MALYIPFVFFVSFVVTREFPHRIGRKLESRTRLPRALALRVRPSFS